MKEVYLNEMSLDGQFKTPEEFLDACMPFMKCLKVIKEQGKWKVMKHSEFYKRKITEDFCFNDLRGMRGDKVRRLKSLLLSTTDNPPYWDLEDEFHQNLERRYYVDGQEVSATSVAEASEAESFQSVVLDIKRETPSMYFVWKETIRSVIKAKILDRSLP